MRAMRVLACVTAALLAACTFDGSGTESGGDDGDLDPDAAGTVEIDARPIDAAQPPIDGSSIPVDAAPGTCNFDFTCDPGETPDTCWDCGGGGFVCDFDSTCDTGESPECPDCDSGGFVCDFDLSCETGEDPSCIDCLGGP
jgi:hypothetical protein